MQRPTSVTVFGILNIVFAAIGVIGTVAGIVTLFAAGTNSDNPVLQAIRDNPAYAAFLKVSILPGLLACVALLLAGIGLLKLKPWARTLSIVYGFYAILMVIVNSIANYYFLVQPMLEKAHGEQGPQAAAAMGGAFGSMFGGCFGIIYPILLLIFMTRPKVVAAFNPVASPGGLQPPQ
jgi:hypothetical protein